MKAKTIDEAVGKWRGILLHFGLTEDQLNGKHQACPSCGGKDRWRFDDKNGLGTSFCSGCGASDGLGLLMKVHGWAFREAAKNVDGVIGNIGIQIAKQERSEAHKIATITRAIKESRKVTAGDPVWQYLHRRTGIDLIPSDVRYHPGMRHSSGGTHPVMLSVMRDQFGAGVSAHRTYLTDDGQKAAVDPVKKFMQGKALNGSAVRLGPMSPDLGIAEGIETALAASQKFGMTVWAATNAVLLQSWIPPEHVNTVTIFGDNDSDGSFAGEAAAYTLAKRLIVAGLKVSVKIPEGAGHDWAD